MVKAVRVHTIGGRHHLQVEEVELPHPGCNEVEVRHTAIGLNDSDVEDCRGGLHHPSHQTFTPGCSAVGVITELGTGVLNHQIGQRVGYVNPPNNKGAFSEASIVPTNCLIPLPSNITDEEAAALLFPGLTAWMLLKKLCPLRRGDAVLVHGVATGLGLGSIISQWAKHDLKAVVIGTVNSEGDVERAQKNGCNEVIVVNHDSVGFAEEVKELTSGEGVTVVFDLEGKKSNFVDVVHGLAPKGMLVSLGCNPPVLNLRELAGSKSLVVAVPVLADYVKHPAELLEGAQFLFDLYKAGAIKVEIAKKFPFNTINQALHATSGEPGLCILIPPIPDPKSVPHGS